MALNTFALAFPPVSSVTEAITATPSGTQLTGVQLVSRTNRVSVCATSGDSVVLPPWQPDMQIIVANDGAAPLGVYPTLGQQISSAAINAVFTVTNAKTAVFYGTGTSGKWAVMLSA